MRCPHARPKTRHCPALRSPPATCHAMLCRRQRLWNLGVRVIPGICGICAAHLSCGCCLPCLPAGLQQRRPCRGASGRGGPADGHRRRPCGESASARGKLAVAPPAAVASLPDPELSTSKSINEQRSRLRGCPCSRPGRSPFSSMSFHPANPPPRLTLLLHTLPSCPPRPHPTRSSSC